MFKKSLVSVLLSCLSVQALWADYSLPPVDEQLILLVDLRQIELSNKQLNFVVDGTTHNFPVQELWMQDRIYSDGICVIDFPYSKSALSRIHDIQSAINKQNKTKILIELVSTEGTENFYMVSYMKLFDQENEYSRYFPIQEYYDTIKLPASIKPNSAEAFTKELEKLTRTSKEKIKNSLTRDARNF